MLTSNRLVEDGGKLLGDARPAVSAHARPPAVSVAQASFWTGWVLTVQYLTITGLTPDRALSR
jgi:hypothetical protein